MQSWEEGRGILRAAVVGALDNAYDQLLYNFHAELDGKQQARQQLEQTVKALEQERDASNRQIESLSEDVQRYKDELVALRERCDEQQKKIEELTTRPPLERGTKGLPAERLRNASRTLRSTRSPSAVASFAGSLEDAPGRNLSVPPSPRDLDEKVKDDTQLQDILRKYKKLYDGYKDLANANETLIAQSRNRRDQIFKWMEAHNILDAKVTLLKNTLEAHGIAIPKSSGDHTTSCRSDVEPHASDSGDYQLPPLPHERPTEEPRANILQEQLLGSTTESSSPQPGETQGDPTQRRSSPRRLVKTEPEDDVPVFVSSRSVKKPRVLRESATAANRSPLRRKVKAERWSSSPLGLSAVADIEIPESLDLDQIGDKIATPKKRRQVNARSTSEAPVQTPIGLRRAQSRATRPVVTSSSFDGDGASRSGRAVPPGVLQPRSPNKKMSAQTPGSISRKRRRMEDGFDTMVEDGERQRLALASSKLDGLRTPNERNGHVLNDLLDKQPEPRPTVRDAVKRVLTAETPNRATYTGQVHEESSRESSRNPNPRTPTARDASTPKAIARPGTGSRLRNLANTPGSAGPSSAGRNTPTPLRSLPVERLGLADFKVNPNANHGYDYAFSEVVHKKADRKCLSGCTRLDCCGGQFRKLAEFNRGTRPMTSSQEERDEKMLEDFLGDRRGIIDSMSKGERDELILQAHTKKLADMHGRHRHNFDRRPSPPGFWRADFPDEDELEADRAEARRVEQEMVQRRYEEAMRPGGVWMFRDE